MKNSFRTRYRIVRDGYCGYEVQIKRWWFPFFVQMWWCNSFSSEEDALNAIEVDKYCKYVD